MANIDSKTPTLYQKAIQGSAWVIGARIFQQVLDLVRTVVLARLLFPRDFGQMGIAMLCVAFLDTFTQVGVWDALVQRKDNVREYLDTGWTMGFLRGLLVFGLLFLAAPWVTVFFDGSAEFTAADIKDPRQVAKVLIDPGHPAYGLVYEALPEEARRQMDTLTAEDAEPEPGKAYLAEQFTAAVQGEPLWTRAAFEDLELRRPVETMLEAQIRQQNTARANRIILEELFPDDVQAVILDRKQVTAIIQVVGLCFLIGSMSNIGTVFFKRDLHFGRLFAFQSVGSVVSLATAILIAVYYHSVWALVFGKLAGTVSGVLASYCVHPYRPRWRLELHKVRALWAFGQHVMWGSMARFFVSNADFVMVGKMLGPSALGLYRLAFRFSNLAATEVGDVLSQVTFPAFSRIQDNLAKLKSGYVKSTRNMILLAYPISGGLLALAPEFVTVALGPKWTGLVSTLQLLCLLGIVRCQQGGNVFLGLGRPDIPLKLAIWRLVLIVLSIYPLIRVWGMFGAGLSITLAAALVLPLMLWYVQLLIGHRIVDYLKLISVPLLATGAMVAFLMGMKQVLDWPVPAELFVLVLSGAAVYCGLIFAAGRFIKDYDVVQIVREIRRGWN